MSFAPVGQSSVSPELSGSKANLPDDVRDVIGSDADSVVFWAKADPAEKIATYQWLKIFGFVVMLPCLWPQVCLCCLPSIGIMLCCRARLLQVVVVVTNTCLAVVQGNTIIHEVKIEHIKSIKAYRDEAHACCGCGCCPKTSMNIIEVDDGNVYVSGGENSSVHVQHGWKILGIYDSKRVKEEVMRIKQQIEESKHKAAADHLAAVVKGAVDSRSVGEKIGELDTLLKNGVLTEAEYAEKRKKIIADI